MAGDAMVLKDANHFSVETHFRRDWLVGIDLMGAEQESDGREEQKNSSSRSTLGVRRPGVALVQLLLTDPSM